MFPLIKYYKKDKIISFVFSRNKCVDADIKKNVVIDYDKNGKVVSMDIMDINLENFIPLRQFESLAIEKKIAVNHQKCL